MRHRLIAVFAIALCSAAAVAAPPTHDQLTQLAEDYIFTSARLQPMRASYLGMEDHDGELDIPSEAARADYIERLTRWKAQLKSILLAAGPGVSLVDADDAKLLQAKFDAELNELVVRQTDRRNFAGPALEFGGVIYLQFLNLPIPGREGASAADVKRAWAAIIARLSVGPAYIAAGEKLVTQPGKLQGEVGARQLAGLPDFFTGPLTDAARKQLADDPPALEKFLAARDGILASVANSTQFLAAHVGAWPQNYAIGRDAYNQLLRDEQLLPYDDTDLERMGRDELAHGWAEEAWLVSLSRQNHIPFGPASGGGIAPGGPALVDYYRARIGELTAFVEAHDLVTIPAWLGSISVVETPAFLQPVSPGASMRSPRLFSKSINGFYFITPPQSLEEAASRLDMNEDFDRDRIWSTAAHEAMPGHFLQLSIARRHPDFIRRIQHSAEFAEGWAFYGEEMFVRLGLYGDDLDPRLFTARWERVRGARSLVDAKLATGDWTIAQSVAFFEAQSGFTHDAATAAVSGIALEPGYATSYTVGRLQLETLLSEYMLRMGERASLHDFHDRLLSYGSTPFAVVAPELLHDLDKPASEVRAAAHY